MKKIVSGEYLARLQGLQAQRDRYAQAIGTAYIEFEVAKAQALVARGVDMLPKIGAAMVEFDALKNKTMEKVNASMARQKEVGDAAIRSVGLDPADPRTMTIDVESGAVKILVGAEWVTAED